MITCQQCREDLAEFALGPVDAAHAERMAAHLAACPVCRQELEELQGAWSALSMTLAPIAPRPGVIEGVLARIDGEPVAAAPPSKFPSAPRERILSYVLAASVLIGLTAGFWELTRPAGDDAARRSAENLAARLGKLQQMERALAAKNVRLVSLKQEPSQGAAEASIVWDLAARQWHVYVGNLPAPPAEQAYQVWASDKTGAFIAGPTLEVNDHGLGSAIVDLPDLDVGSPAKAVVTLEPAGGSKQPTGKVVLEAAL